MRFAALPNLGWVRHTARKAIFQLTIFAKIRKRKGTLINNNYLTFFTPHSEFILNCGPKYGSILILSEPVPPAPNSDGHLFLNHEARC